MTEQELRAMVRDAIARQAGRSAVPPPPVVPVNLLRRHASFATFVVPAGADQDGACLIEPAVSCNHCGYCKSYGH